MSTSPAALDWLFQRASSGESGIDRKALAGLLVELARNVEPDFRLHTSGAVSIDPRLQQLRTLLVGREIEVLTRLSEIIEDPEQLAAAVGRVLPVALAQAATDARLAEVLAPTVEMATRNSTRSTTSSPGCDAVAPNTSGMTSCVTPPPMLPHPAVVALAVPTTLGANIVDV